MEVVALVENFVTKLSIASEARNVYEQDSEQSTAEM